MTDKILLQSTIPPWVISTSRNKQCWRKSALVI